MMRHYNLHIFRKKIGLLRVVGLLVFLLSSCNSSSSNDKDKLSPIITQEIIDIAREYKYDFDPTKVVIKEQTNYDYSNKDLLNLTYGETREDHYLVYKFEGRFYEGFSSGAPVYTFGNMFLWDDGLYYARLGETEIRGYWYNSSFSNQNSKQNNADCLVLLSNQENYEENIATILLDSSNYKYSIQMCLQLYYGQRMISMDGYYYYPDVAISFRNYLVEGNKPIYKIGSDFPRSNYTVVHILKSLDYYSVLDETEVEWTIPEDMLDDNHLFYKAGEYSIKVQYREFTTNLVICVE